MLSAGYSSGQLHIAYAMREGFFRFKSRPLSFPKLSFPVIDTAKASGDRFMSTTQPELTIYPNPTTGTATMRYFIPVDGYVSLTLYSILGIPVSTLVDGYQSAGSHQTVFRAADGWTTIQPGLYFCMLRTQTGLRTVSVLIR
jgi:serine protease AprX